MMLRQLLGINLKPFLMNNTSFKVIGMKRQQGDMSVMEYEAKFNDLFRFVPSLVESEHLKSLKFEKGLKNSIRKPLVSLRIQDF